MDHAFQYWCAPDLPETRAYKCLHVPAIKIARDGVSMWTLECFVDGFVQWMDNNLKDDCFYSTSEDYRKAIADGRFSFWFYFKSERDATLFKLFWL
jgi:hypothetical protein